jgi:hypothetical protein
MADRARAGVRWLRVRRGRGGIRRLESDHLDQHDQHDVGRARANDSLADHPGKHNAVEDDYAPASPGVRAGERRHRMQPAGTEAAPAGAHNADKHDDDEHDHLAD